MYQDIAKQEVVGTLGGALTRPTLSQRLDTEEEYLTGRLREIRELKSKLKEQPGLSDCMDAIARLGF